LATALQLSSVRIEDRETLSTQPDFTPGADTGDAEGAIEEQQEEEVESR